MVENKYDGPSLDHTWNSGPWADPDGETVSGTSDDDMGEINTTTLPDGVDPDDLTDTQREIIREWANRGGTLQDIADSVGTTRSYVRPTLKKHTTYVTERASSTQKNTYDDLSETQQRAIDMVIADNGMSQTEISRQLGKSKSYVSSFKSRHSGIYEARRAELADTDAVEEPEPEAESESESGGRVKALIARARGWIAR